MRYWETPPTAVDESEVTRDDAAIWQAADKIVFSRSLDAVTTAHAARAVVRPRPGTGAEGVARP